MPGEYIETSMWVFDELAMNLLDEEIAKQTKRASSRARRGM